MDTEPLIVYSVNIVMHEWTVSVSCPPIPSQTCLAGTKIIGFVKASLATSTFLQLSATFFLEICAAGPDTKT